ncbi:alcohol dehydrogenase family protein [Sediminitomix flava]|uniref:NADPH:quinone reductase-like Zn-dependent oxidoreductase n=1 Tax=Sediminitomix flava TaxID=379075 RepID=A0A315ZCJ6_SEDFL|nr:alcohol dehydrogenase family protein [Sediminitomix flava]PWJ42464.1 NADPH:quinone reductase-like Zn-dependent oxidoreductase [Sediminitomix flava]
MNKDEIPQLMYGIYLKGHGDYDMLEYREDIPVPELGADEVLIKVSAAGVNNTDLNTRIGWYSKGDANSEDASWSGSAIGFPRIQGADVCGRIVAVGKNVSEDRLNERVLIEPCIREVKGELLEQAWYYGSECNGGFAQFTTVASRHAHAVNSTMSDIELASFPCSYSTAENLLTRSRVTENDTVFITGASGGVGSAAIQLAKARGAQVIAVTSPSKVDELKDLGADKVVLRDEDWLTTLGENSVEVVIDLVAGDKFPLLLDLLKPFGRYAVSGAIGGAHVNLDVRTLYLKDLDLLGCTIFKEEVFINLIKRIENGDVKPLVAASYPLKNIVDAQKAFTEKKHTGKIVLRLD